MDGFHIVDMSREGWDEGDAILIAKLERAMHNDNRSAPCEDDCEVTAPFVNMMPEESDHRSAGDPVLDDAHITSPLWATMIDRQIQTAFEVGCPLPFTGERWTKGNAKSTRRQLKML